MKSCCFSLICIVILLVILFFSSCKAVKSSVSESEEKSDSVRIEYIEKVVEKPVKVIVEVPAESKERETPDTTSYLETQFARSTASLRWQGEMPLLFHSLENIPGKPVSELPSKDTRTEAQKLALVDLLVKLRRLYPHAEISGHRNYDKKGKTCPSFDARNEYRDI